MNGWRFLKKLQTLPDEKKNVVAIIGAASCTSVIFIIWLFFVLADINQSADIAQEELGGQAAAVIGPWEAVTDQLGEIINTARTKVGELKELRSQ